jgi:hypothetical protein
MTSLLTFTSFRRESTSLSSHSPVLCVRQVVQGIKVLGANVRHREKERAERATLVTQERLVKGKARALRDGFRRRVPNIYIEESPSTNLFVPYVKANVPHDVLRCTA